MVGSSQEEGTLATGGLCEVSKVGWVHPRDRARPVWLGGRGEGMLEMSEEGQETDHNGSSEPC